MKKIIFVFIFLLFFFNLGATASAESAASTAGLRREFKMALASTAADLKQERADLKASVSAMKQARKDALSEAKVAACQTRQSGISNRSNNLVKRATNQVQVFTQISQRVQQYYNEKLVPAGKTVSNYNSLVSDIATKEAAIAPLLTKAQTDATNFSCDKDHPSDQVLTFNQDMKAVIAALEAYRLSVKSLIVAVRTASGATGESASGSAGLMNK